MTRPRNFPAWAFAFNKPAVEPLAREGRQWPLGGDAQKPAAKVPNEREVQKRVGHARHRTAHPAQPVHGTEKPVAQGQSILPDARMQQFRLQERHVDIGRAFGGAGFARETIAQRRIELRRKQRILLMPRNSNAARMALARPRVDMISSPVAMNVGHMRRRVLEAAAAAVALLQVGGEGTVLGREREHRFKRQFQRIARAHAQVAVNFIAAVGNDFARIEQIMRVEGLLDLPHELVNLLADLVPEIFGARNADAVFAGQAFP